MKQFLPYLFALVCLVSTRPAHAQNHWQPVNASELRAVNVRIHAAKSLVLKTDELAIKNQLITLPAEGQIIALPMPDGSFKNFKVLQTSVMPDALAKKYPEIKTFSGVSVNNPGITVKLDYTPYGFHAMVLDGNNTSFIDPYDEPGTGYYMVHYKRDEIPHAAGSTICTSTRKEPATKDKPVDITTEKNAYRTSNGYTLRTYRLALSCSHQYAQAATGSSDPTISQVLAKMVTTLNRVNGVYERELSISMYLVANEDTLIFNLATGGPNGNDTFSAINSDAGSCLFTNQLICDARIGTANYDIGHVFTTGAGGLSLIGVACQDGIKAQSATGQPDPVGDGFDIDYVAHEIGHEYGASHPFNSSAGNCGGDNLYPPCAYEPGSGSTIMAYAGICSPDDLQPHSDPYFHAVSLREIQAYTTSAIGDGCAVKTPTNNKLVYVPPFSASYNIPYLTPFELTAPVATDSVADTSITYCWEEWDLGDPGTLLDDTHESGPIFRSYGPTISRTRVFPKDTMVLAGILSDAGIENHEGEKVPDVTRTLTFKLTVRDIYNGYGCFLIPDDSVLLNAVNTGSGFAVTSQNDSGAIYIGHTIQNITWNVAGTNNGTVNTPDVDIYMSEDGGYTWKDTIGTFPNTGSVSVPFPNPASNVPAARIKIKGHGNVFFNVNKYDFALTHSDGTDTVISVYPNPAHSSVRIYIGSRGEQHFAIYNVVGKLMYSDVVFGIYDIAVNTWPRGMYFIRLLDSKKHQTIKKFVVE